jgi:hypothetical protein
MNKKPDYFKIFVVAYIISHTVWGILEALK